MYTPDDIKAIKVTVEGKTPEAQDNAEVLERYFNYRIQNDEELRKRLAQDMSIKHEQILRNILYGEKLSDIDEEC